MSRKIGDRPRFFYLFSKKVRKMLVQHKFFIIPVMDSETREADLNRFLGKVRLIHLTKEFVDAGRDSF